MNQIRVTDADIVAFLDDALPSDQQARIAVASLEDPLVAERIEALSLERDRLTGAFDNLLKAAPVIEIEPALETEISEAPTVNTSAREAANDPKPPAWRWRVVAAAALLSVGIGVGTQIPEGSHDKWHMAVADYQVLYATETLTSMELTQSQRWNSLGQTSEALGLPLDRKDVTLQGLDFRRAQLLKHEGAPLAQLAFLDANGDAIAFCFTRTDGPDTAPQKVKLAGLNAITWQQGGMSFILIGGRDENALSDWQIGLSARIES